MFAGLSDSNLNIEIVLEVNTMNINCARLSIYLHNAKPYVESDSEDGGAVRR